MKLNIYWVLGGIILLAVLLLVAAAWMKKRKLQKLGKEGEKQVSRILRRYARLRSYKVIDDLYLPLYDKTTQIDHVLIGFFGILVVETKNLKGEIYGEPKKKDWLHIVGGKRRSLYNPLLQNQTHIDCIRYLCGKENLYNLNIESLVVFTQRKSTLYLPNNLPIIRVERLRRFLRQPRFQQDHNFDVEQIYGILKKYEVTDKKRIADHNKNVRKMAKNNS